jgi:hypothetical protein
MSHMKDELTAAYRELDRVEARVEAAEAAYCGALRRHLEGPLELVGGLPLQKRHRLSVDELENWLERLERTRTGTVHISSDGDVAVPTRGRQ